MDPVQIIKKYYDESSKLYEILINHSIKVKEKALEIAKNVPEFRPDLAFIEEASMLHDIGMFKTNAPNIECFGTEPYIKHGIIGREILESEGFPNHALVCERHLGVGLTKAEISTQNLPLPSRDMLPITIEEKIICLADKFFSKNPNKTDLTLQDIKAEMSRYGSSNSKRFSDLVLLLLKEKI